jgi:branched-chain amino acid transport system ATP-binding protein
VSWRGEDMTARAPHRRAQSGIGWVAQEREIFSTLTVEENLTVAARAGRWDLPAVYDLFPRMAERRRNFGNQLSGGEQQMLAIGRILRTGARFLMLDEPTEGLAPVIIQQIGHTIARLKSEGFTILLVEQNFRFASTVADRYYVVEHGKIIDGFANTELQANMDKLHAYLGV